MEGTNAIARKRFARQFESASAALRHVVLTPLPGIEVVVSCTSKEERNLRGKAFECISLIGLSVTDRGARDSAHRCYSG